MVDYGKAIKRPFSDLKKLGVGALLYMIPFINIITGFFASGYTLSCAKTAMKKDFKLPEWKEWGQLFVKGLLATIIGFIYFIPAMIVGMIVGGAAILTTLGSGNMFAAAGVSIFGFIIFLIVALITLYVIPIAIMTYVGKDNFGAAFNIGLIFKKVLVGEYFAVWIIAAVYAIVVSIIASLLNLLLAVTIIGPWIVSGLASIIIWITMMTMFGEVYPKLKE